MTGSLTVLHAHDGKRLAKRFRVATIGAVTLENYDKGATWFTAEPVAVVGIHDLHQLLRRLEGDPGACIIRGEAAPHVDLARTRKRKVENRGEFAEVPRQWLMLDGDGIPLLGCSVLAEPAEAARALLETFAAHAPELEGASAVVQFSSRAGLDEVAEGEALAGTEQPGRWAGVIKPGVSAHIWFWLCTPLGEAELTRWATAVNARAGFKLIDAATMRTVQPHYCAAPIFAHACAIRWPAGARCWSTARRMRPASASRPSSRARPPREALGRPMPAEGMQPTSARSAALTASMRQ